MQRNGLSSSSYRASELYLFIVKRCWLEEFEFVGVGKGRGGFAGFQMD